MRMNRINALALSWLLASGGQALADADPCAGFKWDVSKERSLFASAPAPAAAGKDSASAPVATPNRLYQLQLLPAEQVAFPAKPGKIPSSGETYAGVLSLDIPASGKYRVAIDMPLWIDVVADGSLVPASDYEGQHACSAPRKIVVFTLDAKRRLQLQVSDAFQATVRLAITPVPAR